MYIKYKIYFKLCVKGEGMVPLGVKPFKSLVSITATEELPATLNGSFAKNYQSILSTNKKNNQ